MTFKHDHPLFAVATSLERAPDVIDYQRDGNLLTAQIENKLDSLNPVQLVLSCDPRRTWIAARAERVVDAPASLLSQLLHLADETGISIGRDGGGHVTVMRGFAASASRSLYERMRFTVDRVASAVVALQLAACGMRFVNTKVLLDELGLVPDVVRTVARDHVTTI